jgi:hypothetical protein
MVTLEGFKKLCERKVIQFSADEDLLSIIWTVDPKVDLEIVVDMCKYYRDI